MSRVFWLALATGVTFVAHSLGLPAPVQAGSCVRDGLESAQSLWHGRNRAPTEFDARQVAVTHTADLMSTLLDATENGRTYVIVDKQGRTYRGRISFAKGKATITRTGEVLSPKIPFDDIASAVELKTHVESQLKEPVIARGTKRHSTVSPENTVMPAANTAKARAAPPPIPQAARSKAKTEVLAVPDGKSGPPPVPEIAKKSLSERRGARVAAERKARKGGAYAVMARNIKEAEEARKSLFTMPADQEVKITTQDGNGTRLDIRGYVDHVQGDTVWIRKTPDVVTENYRELSVELTPVKRGEVFAVAQVAQAEKPKPPRPPKAPSEFAASVDKTTRDRIFAMRNPVLKDSVTLPNGRVVRPGDAILRRAQSGENGPQLRRIETISADEKGYAVLNMEDGTMIPAEHVGQVMRGEGKQLVELSGESIAMAKSNAARQAPPKSLEDFGRGARYSRVGELRGGKVLRGLPDKPGASTKLITDDAKSYTVRNVIMAGDKTLGVELTNGQFKRVEDLAGIKVIDPEDASLLGFRRAQAEAENPRKKPTAPRNEPNGSDDDIVDLTEDAVAIDEPAKSRTPPPGPPARRRRAERVEEPIDPSFARGTTRRPTVGPREDSVVNGLPAIEDAAKAPRLDGDVEEFYPMPDGRVITAGHTLMVTDKKTGAKRRGRVVGFEKSSSGETEFVVRMDDDDQELRLNPKTARSYGGGAQSPKGATPPPVPRARSARVATKQVNALEGDQAVVTLSDGKSARVGYLIVNSANDRPVVIDRIVRSEDGKRIIVGHYDDSGKGVVVLPGEAKELSVLESVRKQSKGAFKPVESSKHAGPRPKSETEFGRYAVARRTGVTSDGRAIVGGYGTPAEEYSILTDAAGNRFRITQIVQDSTPIGGGRRNDELLGVRLEDGTYLYADELASYDIETMAYVTLEDGSRVLKSRNRGIAGQRKD